MVMLRATRARSYSVGTQAAFIVLFLTIVLLGIGRASASTAPPITIDGSPITTSAIEHASVVFVPATGVFNKLGTTVKTSATSLVATKGGHEIGRFVIGSRNAVVDGTTQTLGAAPFLAAGTAMLPLRAVSEAAGASVAYSSAPRSVAIRSKHAIAAVPAAAAVVAQSAAPAATDAAAAPVAATQDNGGIPWWVWLLLALLILALLLWLLSRRKKETIITTTGGGRGDEPVIKTRK